jgi:hypothetical protein
MVMARTPEEFPAVIPRTQSKGIPYHLTGKRKKAFRDAALWGESTAKSGVWFTMDSRYGPEGEHRDDGQLGASVDPLERGSLLDHVSWSGSRSAVSNLEISLCSSDAVFYLGRETPDRKKRFPLTLETVSKATPSPARSARHDQPEKLSALPIREGKQNRISWDSAIGMDTDEVSTTRPKEENSHELL